MSNTNILLAGRSPDLITPAEAMQQAANANNALAQGAMHSMQAQQLGQQMRDDAEVNALMERNGGDLNRAMQDPNLNWRAKQQIGGMIAEQDSARAKAEAAKVDSEIKKWQYAGNTIGNTQSQEQYDAARQHLRGVVGDMVDNLPQQWSPEVATQYGGMAMTHAEKIALQREERQANYQNQSLALQERRLQAAENRANDGGDKWTYSDKLGGMVNQQGVVKPVVDQSGNPIPKQKSEGMSKETFNYANTLRDEYNQQTKDFVEVQTQVERLKKYVDKPSPAGDQAIIFAAMKANDPTSTVRESEFALAAKAGGYGEQVQNAISRIQNGEMLTPTQRQDFLETARRGYEVQKNNYAQVKKTYESLSADAGIDPKMVVSEKQRDVFGVNPNPAGNAPTATNW